MAHCRSRWKIWSLFAKQNKYYSITSFCSKTKKKLTHRYRKLTLDSCLALVNLHWPKIKCAIMQKPSMQYKVSSPTYYTTLLIIYRCSYDAIDIHSYLTASYPLEQLLENVEGFKLLYCFLVQYCNYQPTAEST